MWIPWCHCKSAISKIQFVKILKDDLNHVKAILEPRFQKSSTIKGTRTFHYFKPLSTTRLGMKRINQDNEFSLQVNLEDENRFSLIQKAHENQFLVAAYDKKWYVRIIKQINQSGSDFLVDFMHPYGPSHAFHCPEKRDICWIPCQHILRLVDAPTLINSRGFYQLSLKSAENVNDAWLHFAKARSKFMLGVCCTFSVLLFCIKVGNNSMRSVLILGAFLSSHALKLLFFGVVINYSAFHILFLSTVFYGP